MAKHRRQAFAARCRAAPFGLPHAGERVGFISVPHTFCSGKGFYSANGFWLSHENSNNPLAVELESENDEVR